MPGGNLLGGCDDVPWKKIHSITVSSTAITPSSSSTSGSNTCTSSASGSGTKTFNVPTDIVATAPCCGCGYSIPSLTFTIPNGDSWEYNPPNGDSQSGTADYYTLASIAFRSNPDTGDCEFQITAIAGVSGGEFLLCCYPPLVSESSPWISIDDIIGSHTITWEGSQSDEGCSYEANWNVTVDIS